MSSATGDARRSGTVEQEGELTVGLVQVAEVSWTHRRRQQYEVVDGRPVPVPTGPWEPNVPFTYVPLAAGSLQAYAQQHLRDPARVRFLTPVHQRTSVDDAVARLRGADLVAFSTYVWNINLSLAIARRLKELEPRVLVVFGGPQVPDGAEPFLRRNPQVDVACHGEGEQVFVALLERVRRGGGGDWRDLPSISYLDVDGRFHVNPRGPRFTDLAHLPSPYLTGAFDRLIAEHPGQKWLALWETNRGCPFSCSFCDWGSAVGTKVSRFSMERLKGEIEWFAAHAVSNLFICDANFGMLPRDLDIARMLVDAYERAGTSVAISIQNTKNAPDRAYNIQKALTSSKLVTFGVTLSMQSVTPRVLTAIKRSNISLQVFHDLSARYQQDGIQTYSDLIVGLPGETYDSFADGLSLLLDKGQHNRIAFYNCSILPNAEMGSPQYQADHGLEFVPVAIIREHEELDRTDRQLVPEYLDTVVATATMDRADWVRTRTFAWMADCLHFDRVLQIVLVAAHQASGLPYRALFEALIDAPADRCPVLAWLHGRLRDHARANQEGASDLVPSRQRLGIWWPADQMAVIELVAEGRLDGLYREAVDVLTELLAATGRACDPELLRSAAALNAAMFRVPGIVDDVEVECAYNVLEVYEAVLSGAPAALEREYRRYLIDRTTAAWTTVAEWCEDIVVQVYRRSAFLYPAYRIDHMTGVFEDPETADAPFAAGDTA